jgi:VanZ family protein
LKPLKAFIPAFAWALLILFLSTLPSVNLPETIWDLLAPDKLAHAAVYFILTVLIFYGLHRLDLLSRNTIIFAILISSGYGILMEVIQYSFFPNRYFELLDIIANIIGSIGSLLILKYFLK